MIVRRILISSRDLTTRKLAFVLDAVLTNIDHTSWDCLHFGNGCLELQLYLPAEAAVSP